jgi:hypothetical protein
MTISDTLFDAVAEIENYLADVVYDESDLQEIRRVLAEMKSLQTRLDRGQDTKMVNLPNRSQKVTTDELKERAELLEVIQKAEDDANWTDLDDLKERADLLSAIAKYEDDDSGDTAEDCLDLLSAIASQRKTTSSRTASTS